MPKKAEAAGKKFTALLKKALAAYKGEEPPPRDPVAQLVVAFLQWRSTHRAAEDAFTALMAELIDINDLRASYPHELVAMIGEDYPDATERVIRLKQALHGVYLREHGNEMKSIEGKGKKDQRAYLDTLYGVPQYAAAQVTLLSFGGHAMPVDEKLIMLLEREGALPESLDAAGAEAFLLRQVKAGDAIDAHLALQSWADKSRAKFPPTVTPKSSKVQHPPIKPTGPPMKIPPRISRAAAKLAAEKAEAVAAEAAKKSGAKKPETKAAGTKKAASKKSSPKTPAKPTAAKKAAAKKKSPAKPAAEKAPVKKKSSAKKPAAKKAAAKPSAKKKTTAKPASKAAKVTKKKVVRKKASKKK
ncbi:MAG: hypothetical protein V3V20_07835 [Algisphaera sp.]